MKIKMLITCSLSLMVFAISSVAFADFSCPSYHSFVCDNGTWTWSGSHWALLINPSCTKNEKIIHNNKGEAVFTVITTSTGGVFKEKTTYTYSVRCSYVSTRGRSVIISNRAQNVATKSGFGGINFVGGNKYESKCFTPDFPTHCTLTTRQARHRKHRKHKWLERFHL